MNQTQTISVAKKAEKHFFDEMFQQQDTPRSQYQSLWKHLQRLPADELIRRQAATEQAMIRLGITFSVYGDESGNERIIPFDIIPRIIAAKEWQTIEAGLKQRIEALNLFIDDVYHDQRILKDKVIPEEIILSAPYYCKQCVGLNPPRGIWCHITGTDLVRDGDGQLYVLEDNLRCPSGVSYVLQNRRLMKQTFPQFFEENTILPVDDYGSHLLDSLQYLMEDRVRQPTVALLTPGIYNSAYFEHSFLAQQMGIHLVEGRDLVVVDDFVHVLTTHGLQKVDVIYRRVDDEFLDPQTFREDSLLGVPGIMDVYRRGNVALTNAPGTGVADDKVIYAYVPRIIKFYLDQEPIIPNVPTYLCWEDKAREYVLDNLEKLVVKPANQSGGYGMMIGPKATPEEHAIFAERISKNPRDYVAQPTLSLSQIPVLTKDGLQGRHVDLRPFSIYGKDIHVLPGGLTRVALTPGSLVVNSSQGGGSKDTWVMA